MLIDMHAHSSAISKCCHITASDNIDLAREMGYGGFVLTNHYKKAYADEEGVDSLVERYISEFRAAEEYGKSLGFTVYFGIEVAMVLYSRVEMLIYGVEPEFLRAHPLLFNYTQEKLYSVVHEAGGVLIQAHPFRYGGSVLDANYLDGIEINCHPYYGSSFSAKILEVAEKKGLAVTCGGDYHADTLRPMCGMHVPDDVTTSAELGKHIATAGEKRLLVADARRKQIIFSQKPKNVNSRIEALKAEARRIANVTEHFLLLAQGYMSAGDAESARDCLIVLCEIVVNYEESIRFNGLSEAWESLRHLVDGLVKPSVSPCSVPSHRSAECTMDIGDVLSQNDDDILSSLSEHLSELSDCGEALNRLNKWERTLFFADELLSEVNSGGFDSYLYYHGTHFDKAYAALEVIGATEILGILDRVRGKFPRGRVPKSEDAIQNAMDKLEDGGVDFEAEDELFLGNGEAGLMRCMLAYVKDNAKRFR